MKLKKAIDRVPGGLMLVPLLLGACVHTFAPGAGKYFGSFTNGLIAGTVPILAVWFFCMGATIDLRATGAVLRKSGTLLATKTAVAWIATLVAARYLPADGVKAGLFAGLSVLAITTSMDMTNGGLYAAVMQQYGTKEEAGAFVLMSIESGPLVSMLILGATGVAFFEPRLFAGAVLPFLVGFVLGNLDHDLRDLFGRCVHPLIPFFGFALGNGIDLGVIVNSGFAGVMLGLGVIVVTGIPLILADRLLAGGNGAAGLAASSTAGAAVANPAIIGEMIPRFKPLVPAATAMVATSCLVTAILVPILTALWVRRKSARDALREEFMGPPVQPVASQDVHV
ncbi:2-keto-3-deoxygluconate transporter [Paraburkholderia bannensis]|uniref:2-keto-3-deoxygluconate permease n=1 Tax=Paraburkholderia tropica TaxID=92647 RepID=A0AAQ1GDJ1_9BURK|nr:MULTISPECIES: 2-keto-3-deoxygluconate transporter [Paraburkholderia]QNB12973.1 2-keto-3-deoxygluconate transporter [Paraburkholderia tropica]RQM50871.1 2-keto-3-deoxygluconate transporter [Paraburkholderia bannensis]RQN40397.1 2-keto-3-deoxygluconate transporter [Paraburkholderia tropica]SEJ35919.1 2-keto-3-deoxygluconate permease [Paraburkholderia tropica]